MNLNYTFDQQETDSQNYYFFKNGFSKKELNRIEEDVHTLPWQVAETAGGDKKNRKSNIKWIPQNDDWFWLYEKLSNMAKNWQKLQKKFGKCLQVGDQDCVSVSRL